jgi:hypothetical protein
VKIFQDISTVSVEDDGIIFDSTSVTAVRIKEDAGYRFAVLLRKRCLSAQAPKIM